MESHLTNTVFPLVNAILNGSSAFLLLVGLVMIKQRRFKAHERVMWAAFGVSAIFLASYLWYHTHYASNRFGGVGIIRPIYFTMLISHIFLAVTVLPFILRVLWLGSKGLNDKHRKLAVWVWPVWMYNSLTGVLIYLMLYHWFPGTPRGLIE